MPKRHRLALAKRQHPPRLRQPCSRDDPRHPRGKTILGRPVLEGIERSASLSIPTSHRPPAFGLLAVDQELNRRLAVRLTCWRPVGRRPAPPEGSGPPRSRLAPSEPPG